MIYAKFFGIVKFPKETDCGVFVRGYPATGIAKVAFHLLANPDKYSHSRSHTLWYSRLERTPTHLVWSTIDFYERVLELSGAKGA